MHQDVVNWVRCPTCGSTAVELNPSNTAEVETGSIGCGSCGREYPIEHGIPFLLPPELREEVVRRAAAVSGEEFAAYETEPTPAVARVLERFARTATVVLDLGSGRAPYLPFLNGDVICLDIFPQFLRDLPRAHGERVRVHPICASATHVPIRGGAIDLVFASELIEHLEPLEADRALDEWPRLATKWCVIDTPNGHEGTLLTRLRHLVYRTESMTAVQHEELRELDHHSTFSPEDFRAAGYECHGCIGWVSRERFRFRRLWDVYDAVAWHFPAIAGTLIAITRGNAPPTTGAQ